MGWPAEKAGTNRSAGRYCDKLILNRFGQWKFPAVVGLITTPTLRPDGSLLADPGYDPVTRLILAAPPPIPIHSRST